MRILVVGLGHSGTTWLAEGIASAVGVQFINEPDNEDSWPFAAAAKRGLPETPSLQPGERAPRYELLWDLAFGAGWPDSRYARLLTGLSRSPRSPSFLSEILELSAARLARHRRSRLDHQLVKSVLAFMSLDWIVDHYDPRVIVVWRSPLNRLASLLERGATGGAPRAVRELFRSTSVWPPPPKNESGIEVQRAMWSTCAQTAALLETASRHPDWLVLRHEEQGANPVAGFSRVFEWLGLDWSIGIERYIAQSEGRGDLATRKRVASDEFMAWKRRLNQDQLSQATRVMERFTALDRVGSIFTRCLDEAT
jgi:hypothetical protein